MLTGAAEALSEPLTAKAAPAAIITKLRLMPIILHLTYWGTTLFRLRGQAKNAL
jgi:hypothetical protein